MHAAPVSALADFIKHTSSVGEEVVKERCCCTFSLSCVMTSVVGAMGLVALLISALTAYAVNIQAPFCDMSIPVLEAAQQIYPEYGVDKATIIANNITSDGWNKVCDQYLDRAEAEAKFGTVVADPNIFFDNDYTPFDYDPVHISDWEIVEYGPRGVSVQAAARTFQVNIFQGPTWFRERAFILGPHYEFCGYTSKSDRIVYAVRSERLVLQHFHTLGGPGQAFAYQYDIVSEEYGRSRLSMSRSVHDYGGGRRCAVWSQMKDRLFRFPSVDLRSPAVWVLVLGGWLAMRTFWGAMLRPQEELLRYPAEALVRMDDAAVARTHVAILSFASTGVLSGATWIFVAVTSLTPSAVMAAAIAPAMLAYVYRSAYAKAARPTALQQYPLAQDSVTRVVYGGAGIVLLLLLCLPWMTWAPSPGGHDFSYPALAFTGVMAGFYVSYLSLRTVSNPMEALLEWYPHASEFRLSRPGPPIDPSLYGSSKQAVALALDQERQLRMDDASEKFEMDVAAFYTRANAALVVGAGVLHAVWASEAADFVWLSAVTSVWLTTAAVRALRVNELAIPLGADPPKTRAFAAAVLVATGVYLMATATAFLERFPQWAAAQAAVLAAAVAIVVHHLGFRPSTARLA